MVWFTEPRDKVILKPPKMAFHPIHSSKDVWWGGRVQPQVRLYQGGRIQLRGRLIPGGLEKLIASLTPGPILLKKKMSMILLKQMIREEDVIKI